MDNMELTMVMMVGLLVLYWLLVVLEEEYMQEISTLRYQYRPPIAYQPGDWLIDAAD